MTMTSSEAIHPQMWEVWHEAGLDKPSIARADRVAEIPPGYLGTAGKIGHLSERDIVAISGILAQIDA